MVNEETDSTSRSHEHEQLYDVFLSFKGSDTRKGFTGNLFNALRSKRFKTFMDRDSLNTGNQMSTSQVNVFERSRIAIVVLSENYPSSTFCLEELVKILECRKSINLLVFPIFYEVDSSDVENQTGSYGESIARHENRHGMEKLQIWRSALYEVSCIRGLHFKNRF